jgi:hypothetical protein
MTRCPRCTYQPLTSAAKCCPSCDLDLEEVRRDIVRLMSPGAGLAGQSKVVPFKRPHPRVQRLQARGRGLSLTLTIDAEAVAREIVRRFDDGSYADEE